MNNDLISRSALLEKATGVVTYDEGGWDCNVRAVLVDDVLKAPAVDAVEVVRCKDCKHRDPEDKRCDHPMGGNIPFSRKDDDFCSYGERGADDATD